jgi:error-prone DNA polymerase
VPLFDITAPDVSAAHRRDAGHAVRLGLAAVTGVGKRLAERIVATRDADGPFRDLRDLVRRTGATAAQVEALATAGAFESMGISRREGIWLAGDAAQDLPEFLPDSLVAVQPPLFGDPSSYDVLAADLWATGISTDDHPLTHYRAPLDARGVLTSRAAHARGRAPGRGRGSGHAPAAAGDGIRHHLHQPRRRARPRQRHLLEGVWDSYRRVLRDAPALIARGMLERSPEGVTNLVADAFETCASACATAPATSADVTAAPRRQGQPACCSVLASWSARSSGASAASRNSVVSGRRRCRSVHRHSSTVP